jgi:hypothetical protein
MRKEYGKALRKYFAGQIKEKVPEFQEEKVESIYFWPGQRAFSRSVSDSLKCWIILCPSPKDYDEFTILVGWSVFGRYPELSVIPSMIMPSDDRKEFNENEYMIRLPQLWSKDDIWWVVEEFNTSPTIEELQKSMESVSMAEAESKVHPLVDDAIQKLLNVGIPYLNEYISSENRRT